MLCFLSLEWPPALSRNRTVLLCRCRIPACCISKFGKRMYRFENVVLNVFSGMPTNRILRNLYKSYSYKCFQEQKNQRGCYIREQWKSSDDIEPKLLLNGKYFSLKDAVCNTVKNILIADQNITIHCSWESWVYYFFDFDGGWTRWLVHRPAAYIYHRRN